VSRKAKPLDPSKLVGQRVAVSYNRHECLVGHARQEGERCFPVREKPSSSSPVLGYADEVWLKDVAFFVSPSGVRRIQETGVRTVCCFVVGEVIEARPGRVTKRHGWQDIRLDVFDDACFYRARDRACVRTAKFARLRNRKIEAMGARKGDPVSSARELRAVNPPVPVVGPRRDTWRGDMGGLNFRVAPASEVSAAACWVQERWPGCVIVDGSDDWHAPDHVRVHDLLCAWQIRPVAWWHTGVSGATPSGAVLTPDQYAEFAVRYQSLYGTTPELGIAGDRPFPHERPSCGCYGGEGLLVRTP